MSGIPTDRSESAFDDYKEPYTAAQAAVEANRCLFCHDAPCIKVCPTHIDIPGFIRKIATENVKGSARTIFDSNILGMSCARVCPVEVLCVGDCVFNEMGVPPIQIGRLQRYSTDAAFDAGWRFFEAGADSGRSVGLIGGGPASLACAHELRRHGHRCTIYDKRPALGGLNATGVAPYKMRADRAEAEVDWVLGIGGVEVKTGVSIPDDISFEEVEALHDAVFIGLGLGPDRLLDLPGADLPGIEGAVAWIEEMKLGTVDLSGIRDAVVLGGGNTAIDAVRELLGLGIPSVRMIYRGTEEAMSGYQHEWKAAKVEGAVGVWRAQPIAFVGDGQVTGVRCAAMDAHKRPIAGQDFIVPAELVLLAIGQAKLGELFAGLDGVKLDAGRVLTDADGATGRPRWYAGGDCTNGGKEVVNAAAEGKRAALAIHRLLTA